MPVLETILSGGVGAVIGFLEKPLARYMDRKDKELEYEHIERLQDSNHKHEIFMAEQDLIDKEIAANAKILQQSYQHDSDIGETSKWVNNICKLVRPVALAVLALLAWDNPQVFSNQFSMALSWWFATRVRSHTA